MFNPMTTEICEFKSPEFVEYVLESREDTSTQQDKSTILPSVPLLLKKLYNINNDI